MIKDVPFYIDGQSIRSGRVLEVRNPYNNEVVGTTYRPTASDIEASIETSVKAFEKTRVLSSCQKYEILNKAASIIRERQSEMADILCREAGKPIRHAKGEVTRAIQTITLAAEESKRIEGEILPLDLTRAGGDRLGIVRRFPIGPIAGISPFNFPLNLVCHKVGPALATGNTITIKPASTTPLSALLLGEIFGESGAIPGSLNVIPCVADLADVLVTDPRLKMITFTGSVDIGWMIKSRAGKKKVCLELGGNAAAVIEPDADMDFAIERSLMGGYAYAGQVCISIQRIFIHQTVYDDFTEAFVQGVKQLKCGDPLSEDTDVGPSSEKDRNLDCRGSNSRGKSINRRPERQNVVRTDCIGKCSRFC